MLVHDMIFIDIVLLQIIDKDFLFLRVLIEVLLKSLVADKLFLELICLLELDSLIIECANNVLNS